MTLSRAVGLAVLLVGAAVMGGVPAEAQDFRYPASGTITGKITYCGSGGTHNALDIANSCDTQIYATRPGSASFIGGCGTGCAAFSGGSSCNGGAGNYISITHANGYKSRCLHGRDGSQVTGWRWEGSTILRMGSTGNSTGPHVHFDIWQNGVRLTNWINSTPACYAGVTANTNIPYNFAGLAQATSYLLQVNTDVLNVRSGPGTTYSIIGTVSSGQRWIANGSSVNGFHNIYFDGRTGWVSGSYVIVYTSIQNAVAQRVNTDVLNVRSGPGTGYSILGTISLNQVHYRVALNAAGDWAKIYFRGSTGWCYRPYTEDVWY